MENEDFIDTCRICLEIGATCPIFDNQNDISFKLSRVFREKIEDIENHPKNICEACKNSLDTAYKFVTKYENTNKILLERLALKEEIYLEPNSPIDQRDYSEPEIELNCIKIEPEGTIKDIVLETDYFPEVIKPFKLGKKRKTVRNVKPVSKKTSKVAKLKYTNKVASSILEGEFAWNGEEWCFNLDNLKSKIKTDYTKRNSSNRQRSEQLKRQIKKAKKLKRTKDKTIKPAKLCELCGKVFNSQDRLSVHKKGVHFKKPISCPTCHMNFETRASLNGHIEKTHDMEKNFVCSVCGKGFYFKVTLTNHLRSVHSKQPKQKKTFSCRMCSKTYKCAKSVLIHERSVHTGDRPARCTLCDSSFFHEDYLKEHMRLHTGETPFKCPICGRGYAQRCNMKSHIRIHRISELDTATLSKIKPNYLKLLKA